MQQTKLQRYRLKHRKDASEASQPTAAALASSVQRATSRPVAEAGEASSAPGPRKRKADESSVKENIDPRTPAAASSHEAKAQANEVAEPAAAMAPPQPRPRPQATGSKRTVQLFLDLGQRDFNASRCVTCGMVYAKGQEEDERLHKAHHSSFMQGIKFQGWGRERVLLSDALKGRLIMVQASDPPAHVKKVQEVCAFVERLHGMASGWLLGAPQWRAFLYISTSKRVVGVAVMEPLKHAYRVAATTGEEVQSRGQKAGTSSGLQAPVPVTGAATNRQQAGASTSSSHQQQQHHHQQYQQQQQTKFTWRSRSSAQAASDPSLPLPSSSGGPSSSHMAGSCPSSLLHAAGGLHMSPSAGAMPEAAMPAGGMAAAATSAAATSAAATSAAATSASAEPHNAAAASSHRPEPQTDEPQPSATRSWPAQAERQQRQAASQHQAGRAMPMADKSRVVKALAGVRMVWVSSEQRRQGLATKLLDAARCNMIPGFVVSRQQMAFTQPTEHGVQLARKYTGTDTFLVYGLS